MTNLSNEPSLTVVPETGELLVEGGPGNRPRGLPIRHLQNVVNETFYERLQNLRSRLDNFGPATPLPDSPPVIKTNDGSPLTLSVHDGATGLSTLVATGKPVPTWSLRGINAGLFTMTPSGALSFKMAASVGSYHIEAVATNALGERTIDIVVNVVASEVAPLNTVPPQISGDTLVWSTFTYIAGNWTGFPTPSITAGWRRRLPGSLAWEPVAVAIPGVPYTKRPADAGYEFSVLENAVNSVAPASASSNIIGPISQPQVVCDVRISAPDSIAVDQPLTTQLALASGTCSAWQIRLLNEGQTGGPTGTGSVSGQNDPVGSNGTFTQNISNLTPGNKVIWAKCTDSTTCAGAWATKPILLTAGATPAYVAPFGQIAADYPAITFQDDFNGSSLDSSKWITKEPWWGSARGNTDNFAVEDGELKIWLGRLPNGDFEFHNRAINTHGKFFQRYGYFEIYAQLPRGIGCWPSFWLYGYDHNGGPTTEIDIMEAYTGSDASSWWTDGNYNPISYGATCWYGPPQTPTMIDMYKLRDSHSPNGVNLNADFHWYGCRWDSTGVTFYFDGTQIGPKIISPPGFNATELPIIIAMGPGDSARPTAGIPTQATVDAGLTIANKSNSYRVKHVRCWSLADGSTTVR